MLMNTENTEVQSSLPVIVTGFEITLHPRTIINIYKYQFELFEVLQLRNGNRHLHEIYHDFIAVYKVYLFTNYRVNS